MTWLLVIVASSYFDTMQLDVKVANSAQPWAPGEGSRLSKRSACQTWSNATANLMIGSAGPRWFSCQVWRPGNHGPKVSQPNVGCMSKWAGSNHLTTAKLRKSPQYWIPCHYLWWFPVIIWLQLVPACVWSQSIRFQHRLILRLIWQQVQSSFYQEAHKHFLVIRKHGLHYIWSSFTQSSEKS